MKLTGWRMVLSRVALLLAYLLFPVFFIGVWLWAGFEEERWCGLENFKGNLRWILKGEN
jgi:hypothetical protein